MAAGCELDRAGGSRDVCEAVFGLTRQVTSAFEAGLEIFHQTAGTRNKDTRSVGADARYDLYDHFRATWAAIKDAKASDRLNWYASVLFTF